MMSAITNHEEHQAALAEALRLMEANPEVGSENGRRLDELATEIERYEDIHYPLNTPAHSTGS